MAETFRPEKRPISPQDMTPEQVTGQLADAQLMRRVAEIDELESEQPQGIPQLPGMVKGPIPQKVLRALHGEQAQPQQNAPRQRPQSQDQIPTNTKLAEVLATIKPFAVNYEPVYLPSKGKFYDGNDGPQDGVIHMRPMTGAEEEILATPRFVRKGQAINMIFNHCIQEKFDTDKFLTPDRTYLLIYLRGISYSPEYEVELKCPACTRKFQYTIDLNDLYVDQCPEDAATELTGVLPTTGLEFRYRLSRGHDEQQIQDYRERKMRGGFDNSGQSDDTLLYRTALLIEDIAGLTNKTEILRLLRELPIGDVSYLRNLTNEPGFGVDTNVEIYCPGCTHDFTVDLPLEANFFFPRGKKQNKKM